MCKMSFLIHGCVYANLILIIGIPDIVFIMVNLLYAILSLSKDKTLITSGDFAIQ